MDRLRILLVSEQQRLLDALVEGVRLRWPSAEMLNTTDSSVALRRTRHYVPHLLVIDLSTAGALRWSLVADIRKLSDAPVIVFASGGQPIEPRRAAALRAYVFSRSPFSARLLLGLIDEIVPLVTAPATHHRAPRTSSSVGTRHARPAPGSYQALWRHTRAPASVAALVTLLALAILLVAAAGPQLAAKPVDSLCAFAPDELSDEFELVGLCPLQDDDDGPASFL